MFVYSFALFITVLIVDVHCRTQKRCGLIFHINRVFSAMVICSIGEQFVKTCVSEMS